MYSVASNYQASLSPRFSNVNYGANIRYNLPDQGNMGVPSDPLSHESEGYGGKPVQNSCNGKQCNNREQFSHMGKNNLSGALAYDWTSVPVTEDDMPNARDVRQQQLDTGNRNISYNADYDHSRMNAASVGGCNGNVCPNERKKNKKTNRSKEVQQMQNSQRAYTNVTDILPVSDITTANNTMTYQSQAVQQASQSQNRSGGVQPVIYDRFIYANSRSRLRGQADPIRGDLPIVPQLPSSDTNSGVWFRPSVTPHIDLQRGALAVTGGYENTTNNQLRSLMNASIDGTLGTFGGNNIPVQRDILRNSGGDIVVSAFP